MSLPIIVTNSDNVIELTITDSAGNPIDLAEVDDVEVAVYCRKENIIQHWKQSLNQVTIVDAPNGIINVVLDRANTSTLSPNRLYAEIVVKIPDVRFESGYQLMIESDIAIADIINSAIY